MFSWAFYISMRQWLWFGTKCSCVKGLISNTIFTGIWGGDWRWGLQTNRRLSLLMNSWLNGLLRDFGICGSWGLAGGGASLGMWFWRVFLVSVSPFLCFSASWLPWNEQLCSLFSSLRLSDRKWLSHLIMDGNLFQHKLLPVALWNFVTRMKTEQQSNCNSQRRLSCSQQMCGTQTLPQPLPDCGKRGYCDQNSFQISRRKAPL